MRKAIEAGEAEGKYDDPRYKKAMAEFLRRHYSDRRVRSYNEALMTANLKIHRAMMGIPESFTVTGNLASWNVKPKLKQIHVPTLGTVEARDLATPACAKAIHRGINGSRLVIFGKSAHDAPFKERDLYMETVREFLDDVSR
jgi:proline-specific peptidase